MDNDTHLPATPPTPEGDQTVVLERLGTTLKEARLQRGIDRAALASKLCMGEEQLAALENADQSKLPEPVFVIAQSRRVADALGLDISLLIAPLKTATPIASPRPGADALGKLPSRSSGKGRGGSVQRLRRTQRSGGGSARLLGGAALVAGLAAAGFWAWPFLQRLPLKSLSLPSGGGSTEKPRASHPRVATKPAVPAGQLLLNASQPSWLEVQNTSKQVLFKGTFQGERRFPLGQGLKVLAGRPDLVRVSVGGSPARPLGTIDQIRWVRFTAGQPFTAEQPFTAAQPTAKTPAPAP